MIQIADLCAYSIRRYLENNESDFFDLIFQVPAAPVKFANYINEQTRSYCVKYENTLKLI